MPLTIHQSIWLFIYLKVVKKMFTATKWSLLSQSIQYIPGFQIILQNFGKLYYLFFYLFNLFTITLLTSLHYVDILFFLAVLKINLWAHFSQKLQVSPKFWSMIWKPDKILLSMIGGTCMYCKNWVSNGHFCGSKIFF